MCASASVTCALPGAQGFDDEGGANQGLHFPPRSPLILQTGARQSCQASALLLVHQLVSALTMSQMQMFMKNLLGFALLYSVMHANAGCTSC